MAHITHQEALALLKENKTPEHVVKHCMAVARTSVLIGCELNKHGYDLSIDLIEGSAMLHDIARVFDNHELVGADILESRGFYSEARIIKEHMHHEITMDIRTLSEIDIVCLGDRMVMEDQYVGLEARMNYILNKWEGNPKAQEMIKRKVMDQSRLVMDIEELINQSIDDLMKLKM